MKHKIKTINIQNELDNFLSDTAGEFRDKIKKYLDSKGWEYDNVEYTSISDKLIDKVNSTQYKFPRERSHGCFIKGAVHARGTLYSYLILGVNDKTQLNSDYIYIKDFNLVKKKTRK